jgi:FYVE, RhoGEF and PH domain containing 5/6
MLTDSPSSSTIGFPTTDSVEQVIHHSRPPYLPFRRISLPTPPPPPNHRDSTVSLTSVDSFPDEHPGRLIPNSGGAQVAVRNVNPVKKQKRSSTSLEVARRKRRDLKPIDEAREIKKRKVIDEFYATEKAYVGGLELIYSVRVMVRRTTMSALIYYLALSDTDYCLVGNSTPSSGSRSPHVCIFQLYRHMEPA